MLKYLNPGYYLRAAQRGGYTIDQTILIVVIIAILITLVIVTVGWQLIGRTTGTRLGSQMKQIEDATGQFYSEHKTWPHLAASSGLTTANIPGLLAGITTAVSLTIDTSKMVSYLPGIKVNGTGLDSPYNAPILMGYYQVTNWTGAPAAQNFYVVQMENVPLSDAKEADEAIDGTADRENGRLVYTTASTCLAGSLGAPVPATLALAATSSVVRVCYVASGIQ